MNSAAPSLSSYVRRFGPLGLVTLGASAILALAFACGPSPSASGLFEPDSAVVDVETRVSAVCPSPDASTFKNGSSCSAPEGTTCAVTECGGMFATCERGAWRFSSLGPPLPACPSVPPTFGAPCSACWQNSGACYYGCAPGETPTRARCRTLGTFAKGPTWTLDNAPCDLVDAGQVTDAPSEASDAGPETDSGDD